MAGLLVLRIPSIPDRYAGISFLGCIWPATLLLAHRGSYLFVPTVMAGWLLYLAVMQMVSVWPSRSIATLRLLSFALPSVIAGILVCVAGMRFGYIPSMSANETFSSITGLILDRKDRGRRGYSGRRTAGRRDRAWPGNRPTFLHLHRAGRCMVVDGPTVSFAIHRVQSKLRPKASWYSCGPGLPAAV